MAKGAEKRERHVRIAEGQKIVRRGERGKNVGDEAVAAPELAVGGHVNGAKAINGMAGIIKQRHAVGERKRHVGSARQHGKRQNVATNKLNG